MKSIISRPTALIIAALIGIFGSGAATLYFLTSTNHSADVTLKTPPQPAQKTPDIIPWNTPLTEESIAHNGQLVRFKQESFWYHNVQSLPRDPQSDKKIAYMTDQLKRLYNGVATINISDYSNSFYRVNDATPRIDMEFDDCQNKGYLASDFAQALKSVPMPADAQPAPGDDGHLTLYDQSSDTLWEFWRASKDGDTWRACWGGVINNASSSNGTFAGFTGATASGISLTGGTLSKHDIATQQIEHALYLAVYLPAKGFVAPAQRSDGGNTDTLALKEGQFLRLKRSVKVNQLKLSPLGKAIAHAAQRYGFVIADGAGTFSLTAQNDASRDTTGGLHAQHDNTPIAELLGMPRYQVLRNFPWDKMEVVQMQQ